jgi:hypothetical protein
MSNAQVTTEPRTMTMTRHDTLRDTFDASALDATLIVHRCHGEWFTVPFASLVWAERAGLKLVHDFSAIGGPAPYHDSIDYR